VILKGVIIVCDYVALVEKIDRYPKLELGTICKVDHVVQDTLKHGGMVVVVPKSGKYEGIEILTMCDNFGPIATI
jgi:hypothetical protein